MTGKYKLNSRADLTARRALVTEILSRLDQLWRPSQWTPSNKPVDELVGTILSQNTSDVNTGRAFNSLRNAFTDWHSVASADTRDVVEAIRSGGLAQQKAPRIQEVLKQIIQSDDTDPNATLMDQLERMDPAEAMDWLTSFPGIGPKTAACVLMFAVGQPVVPVDTHVHRVSQRVGLISPKASADRAHVELIDIVEPEECYRFHMHLINHGRTICRARNPRCDDCTLADICDYFQSRVTDS